MITTDHGQLPRRRALGLLAATVGVPLAGGGITSARAFAQTSSSSDTDAGETWSALLAGNARFAGGTPRHPRTDPGRRASLVDGQNPVATVLGCADSRVPPELVFDQGLGDLFTVRSAGEVLDEAVLGSLEFGIEHLRTPLTVVLGHARCGAVTAAIDVVRGGPVPRGDVAALVQAIEPAVRSVPDDPDDDAFRAACIDEQTRRVAAALPHRSSIIREAIEHQETRVVAAVYDLASGLVHELG
ncbi:carbonic anhydrase [Actinobacteria bacterium YIM 96077]|uniref:carbonic anhydrase n=1 Tax=Phytoactinopolyspora halophila TaxID=1981511 RepID=A0A329QR94_9ACTN|nr:carbonic anhydrase [Phytoactinopolyspora halophila]AYY12964.1 carbonic anhydrase [Actinobacteria bacterium YIM 96077]RAW13228.1 carbonic anhydrase [Phytoactinopolyspora halophila]